MSGAAVLCGSAALRGGAGLVTVACPHEIQAWVAVGNPCYTSVSISQHADGSFSPAASEELYYRASAADVLAVGPGLGSHPTARDLVRQLLLATPDKATVVDADGLNSLIPIPEPLAKRSAPLVMTPHPGEFARLTGLSTEQVQANRKGLAVGFAMKWNAVLVLKGHRTLVTDGQRIYENGTGNPGMATGGTGDVLTGLIAALVAQKLPAFDSAVLGVWVHGRAGDHAAADLGQAALTAADLLNYLPRALREVGG
jgi:NAD(P)H-hydrate epimerase